MIGWLDPTVPARWEKWRTRGKAAFLVRTMIVSAWCVGGFGLCFGGALGPEENIGAGVAYGFIFSAFVFGPMVGALAAHSLWARGERRAGRDLAAELPPRVEAVREADATQATLDEYARRVAWELKRAPELFQRRLSGMVWLGYAYLLGALVLLLAATVWLFLDGRDNGLSRLAFIPGFFALMMILAMRVRWIGLEERKVTRSGSPELFAALDRMRQQLDVPELSDVQVDDTINAAASELPRGFIFGPWRRQVTVGLPLLDALSQPEAEAILAHELAHLSRAHVRGGMDADRLLIVCQHLSRSIGGGNGWAHPLFIPFLRWFVPRFELLGQARRRGSEFEADALAARVCGTETAAAALLRITLAERVLRDFALPATFALSATREHAPAAVVADWRDALRVPRDRAWVESILAEALSMRTAEDDTHPSVRERIEALGVELGDGAEAGRRAADLLARSKPGAAEPLLGGMRAERLRTALGTSWSEEQTATWRALRGDHDLVAEGADDARTRWARARLAARCAPPDDAVPLLRSVMAEDAPPADAPVLLGRILITSIHAAERAEGARFLERVLLSDRFEALVAADLLARHFAREGNARDRSRVLTRQRQLERALEKFVATVGEPGAGAPLAVPDLSPRVREALRRACEAEPDLGGAWLVETRNRHLRDEPVRFLFVSMHTSWYVSSQLSQEKAESIVARIGRAVEGFVLVQGLDGSRLKARVRDLKGAQVFSRAK